MKKKILSHTYEVYSKYGGHYSNAEREWIYPKSPKNPTFPTKEEIEDYVRCLETYIKEAKGDIRFHQNTLHNYDYDHLGRYYNIIEECEAEIRYSRTYLFRNDVSKARGHGIRYGYGYRENGLIRARKPELNEYETKALEDRLEKDHIKKEDLTLSHLEFEVSPWWLFTTIVHLTDLRDGEHLHLNVHYPDLKPSKVSFEEASRYNGLLYYGELIIDGFRTDYEI